MHSTMLHLTCLFDFLLGVDRLFVLEDAFKLVLDIKGFDVILSLILV